MSGIFNLGSRNTQPNKLGSIQIQTSEFGVCIPVLYGSNRVAPKLIDYVNFTTGNPPNYGGKGGSTSAYEYYAEVLQVLWKNGRYPSNGVGNIYDQGGAMELTPYAENFTIPANGGAFTVTYAGSAFYYDEGVTYQGSYSADVNDYGSDGLVTLSGFDTLPMELTDGTPGPLQYSVSPTGTYTFSIADAGKVVTINYAYTQTPTHVAQTSAPAEYLKLTVFNGRRPQAPWGYLSSNYPSHALDYVGLVMTAGEMDLGEDATVPSFNFEGINGNGLSFGGGVADCDPSAIINSILTDPFIGMGYAAYLGDLSQLSNYCVANGIFLSPYYDSATACSSVIQDLAQLANTEIFSSWDGMLKAVPYGDTTVIGFGRQYTPATQPLYDFDVDDFLEDGDSDPLTIDYPNIADNSNYMKLEFKNRANSYNADTIDDINQASVNVIGLRPADTIQAHSVCTAEVAQLVLNALLTRKSYPFRTFKFKLNQCYPHLECMDIITVTHPNPAYGLTRWPVRIISLEEDEKTAELSIEAQDFPWGVGQPAKYPRSPGGGSGPPGYEYPGSVLAPIIFEANDRISRSGSGEIWIGVSGQTDNWGGCHVWVSTDGTMYKQAGPPITIPARMGYLLSAVPSVADPDSTTEFDVVPTGISDTGLTSASAAAADGFQTLCYLDSELISYSTVIDKTVGTTGVEALTTYTRRGVFGTPVGAHGENAVFLRLDDDAVFAFAFDSTLIGKTIYLKFTSFNLVKQMEESLSDVQEYPFFITGKFGNSGKTVNTDLVIDSIDAGASTTIRVYGPNGSGVPTVGDGGHLFPEGKPAINVPAASLVGFGYTMEYLLNWNPNTNGYVVYTDPVAQANDQALGMLGIGSVETVSVGGSGGAPGGASVSVSVTPGYATITNPNEITFSATVIGTANHAVTWYVDGHMGGNTSVGVINGQGTYGGASVSGTHTIEAVSVSTPTASGTATVNVA